MKPDPKTIMTYLSQVKKNLKGGGGHKKPSGKAPASSASSAADDVAALLGGGGGVGGTTARARKVGGERTPKPAAEHDDSRPGETIEQRVERQKKERWEASDEYKAEKKKKVRLSGRLCSHSNISVLTPPGLGYAGRGGRKHRPQCRLSDLGQGRGEGEGRWAGHGGRAGAQVDLGCDRSVLSASLVVASPPSLFQYQHADTIRLGHQRLQGWRSVRTSGSRCRVG